MSSYKIYYRASTDRPLTLAQLRRNGAMMDALRQRGLAVENVNVGHDPELRARIAGAVGGRGGGGADEEEDWPVAFSPAGVAIGGPDALARHFTTLPTAAAAPRAPAAAATAQASRESAQRLLAEREATQARLEQARRGASEGVQTIEDSLHVLDMRLSVLGDQFRPGSGQRASYPSLRSAGAEDANDDDDDDDYDGGGGDDDDGPTFFVPGSDSARAPSSAGAANAKASTELPMRTVDVALEGLEWAVVKGYGWVHSMVASPPAATATATGSNAAAPARRATTGSSSNRTSAHDGVAAAADDDDDGTGHVDADDARQLEVEVVQTNWYGRQQKRLLRVTAGELLRVHPMTGDVRKRVLLQDITSVIVARDRATLRVVVHGDVANADVYQSLYVQQLLDAIVARQPSVRIIEGG